MVFRRMFALLGLCLCIFGLGFSAMAQDDLPYIQWGDCPFDVPEDETEGQSLDCGVLVTYEDHFSEEGEAQVEIAFAILYANNESSSDPVIYLEGGPGGSALSSADMWAQSSVRNNNDLILLDQRGMGFSLPSLNCIEVEEYDGDDAMEAEQACYDRFIDEGIDLETYNSAQSAADIADLMTLLQEEIEYTEFNLLGISYGTRLALTIMRDYPDNLRSVIIDSVYPPNDNAYENQALNNYNGLRALFDGCEADPDCAEAYPDLESVFYEAYETLNETPATYEGEDEISGEVIEQEMSGDGFLDLIVQSLYSTTAIPELPLVIYEVSEGNYDILGMIDSGEIADQFSRTMLRQDEDAGDISDSEGAFHVIECKEELPFNSFDVATENSADIPDPIHDYLLGSVENQFAICELYGLEPADPIETEAVESDIPTLVLAGNYDPITPPASAQLAAETLSNSFYFEFSGYGHGITDGGDCAVSIIEQFLEDPTSEPDGSCIDELEPPAFVIR